MNIRPSLQLLLTLCASPLAAQYARSPADTLRYREISTGTMVFSTPGGPLEVRSEHDAILGIAFGASDQARAWYERLHIASISPQERNQPQTQAALNRAFVLDFDSRGRIQTVSAPQFPESFANVTDLSFQFVDYFLRLPAEPLALGVSWQDTAVVERRTNDQEFTRHHRLIRARVIRDTSIAGEEAWVIETIQDLTMASAHRVRAQALMGRTSLAGRDSGIYLFSKQNGRMISRTRSGSMTGTVTYEGGAKPVTMRMISNYENSIALIDTQSPTVPVPPQTVTPPAATPPSAAHPTPFS